MKTAVAALALAIALLGNGGAARADGTTNSESAPATSAAPAAAPAAPGAAASTTEPPAVPARHRTLWPWIIMGTGVALVITAGVVELLAVKEDDKREADETKLTALPVNTPSSDPEKKALLDSAAKHDKSAEDGRTAALIIGSVGFLAMAGAVVWWFVEGGTTTPEPPPSAKAKPKPTFHPSFGPGYAGATLLTTF